jgi:putative membrane protein
MNRRVLIWVSAISLAIFVYAGAGRLILRPLIDLPDITGGVPGQTLALLVFSLAHAVIVLGWRHTLAFFAITAVVSWGYEQVGVETGLIYGAYYYTDFLGPKLGHVPLLIPLAWFMMIYPSYVIANLIAHDRPSGTPGGLLNVVWLAFLSAMIMTAWDLVVDPFLTAPPFEAWVWVDGGPYFGIPLQNFAGWLLTTFSVYLIYRLIEHWRPPVGLSGIGAALVIMPLIAYGAIMISNSFAAMSPEAMRLIGPFAMGLPLALALTRWFRYRAAG